MSVWVPYMLLRGLGAYGFEAEGWRVHMMLSALFAQGGAKLRFVDVNPWAREVPGAMPENEVIDEERRLAKDDADGGFARALLRKFGQD